MDIYDLIEFLPEIRNIRRLQGSISNTIMMFPTIHGRAIEQLYVAILLWQQLQRGRQSMNARQAAKAAAKRIEDLETYNRLAGAEIKWLNKAIDDVIAGRKTFCAYCEDRQECQLQAHADGKGCDLWMLSFDFNATNVPEEKEFHPLADGALPSPADGKALVEALSYDGSIVGGAADES